MSYPIDVIKTVLLRCADRVSRAKDELERIDSESGDGDLGISMSKASDAIRNTVAALPEGQNDIGKLFSRCAMAVNSAAPSTMGTLICAGLMQLGKSFAGKSELDDTDLCRIPGLFAAAIMQRGKAAEGDRTVLDALLPASRIFTQAAQKGTAPAAVLSEAVTAARDGMERTKTMVPRIGRAKWMPDNATGHPDGGAYLCCLILDSFTE